MSEYPVLAESTYHAEVEEWRHSCGAVLMTATVSHPIHDSPFAGAGSGQVYHEAVPYCPTCQEKPSRSGSPIRSDPIAAQETHVLRHMRDTSN